MGFAFNPFTGTFDLTGSGGGGASYIDGEVQNFSALPQTIGSPAVDSAYLVREAEGAWLLARKPAGIYIRTADTGVRAADWTHAGAFPDVFNDANFLLYDNGDSTKNLQFQLSGIATGTTRTLTVPNTSGEISIVGHTHIASDIVFGQFANSRINWASPDAIGSSVASSGAFTRLTATPAAGSALTLTGGTVTASAPLISATQTWNDAAVTFTGLLVNVTSTNSAAASLLANFQVGGTSVANIRRDGRILATSFALVSGATSGTGFSYHSAAQDGGHIQCFNNAGSQIFTATTLMFRCSGDLSLGRAVGLGQSPDTILVRDDAGMLAQRNAANAQTFRLYNTFTSTTNFERLNIAAQTGGSFIIGTEKGSGSPGGSARALEFRTDNTARLTLGDAGGVTIADANDIAVGTTTGTKIGTATTQKLGFWNATPVIQQSSTGTNATGFTANGPHDTVHADSTFTGNVGATAYSISDIVKHLKTIGLIAS